MMTKTDIVAEMAQNKMVETMVVNIAHCPMDADLMDLSQMVYVILLEYDDAKIIDLWQHKQMSFFVAKIIINQYRSSNSPYYALIRKFRSLLHENPDALRNVDILENNQRYSVIQYENGD